MPRWELRVPACIAAAPRAGSGSEAGGPGEPGGGGGGGGRGRRRGCGRLSVRGSCGLSGVVPGEGERLKMSRNVSAVRAGPAVPLRCVWRFPGSLLRGGLSEARGPVQPRVRCPPAWRLGMSKREASPPLLATCAKAASSLFPAASVHTDKPLGFYALMWCWLGQQ